MEEDQPSYRIRSMLPEDVAGITEIDGLVNPSPWSESRFRAELENPRAHIDLLAVNGEIAAYICCWQVADEMEIQNVATAPGFRRLGYASRLLEHVLERAARAMVSRVFLEVRIGNMAARSLYESFQFQECGIRENYYADNEDALLMECDLSALSK